MSEIDRKYLAYGPDKSDTNHLAVTVGKSYSVYACRKDENTSATWYFIYTDNEYLWWMPAVAFEIIQDDEPRGWVTLERPGKMTLKSYPSLQEWSIEEGIIDGESAAEKTYIQETEADPTFPEQELVESLNAKLDRKLKMDEYERKLDEARANGWERPEKPE